MSTSHCINNTKIEKNAHEFDIAATCISLLPWWSFYPQMLPEGQMTLLPGYENKGMRSHSHSLCINHSLMACCSYSAILSIQCPTAISIRYIHRCWVCLITLMEVNLKFTKNAAKPQNQASCDHVLQLGDCFWDHRLEPNPALQEFDRQLSHCHWMLLLPYAIAAVAKDMCHGGQLYKQHSNSLRCSCSKVHAIAWVGTSGHLTSQMKARERALRKWKKNVGKFNRSSAGGLLRENTGLGSLSHPCIMNLASRQLLALSRIENSKKNEKNEEEAFTQTSQSKSWWSIVFCLQRMERRRISQIPWFDDAAISTAAQDWQAWVPHGWLRAGSIAEISLEFCAVFTCFTTVYNFLQQWKVRC